MPQTYNGVGTHYYGKKNHSSRMGVCPYCGSQRRLESYDTRLWFVVFFIPLIPLGRKRILDFCPGCTRHHAAPLSQWEMAKQLNVSGAMEEYRRQPTPETAAAFHGHLLGFHMASEAAEFRQTALVEFPDSASLHAALAEQLQQAGQLAEATPLFEKALELRPDLPEARIGVALVRISAGELDEARQLLSFLEQPGASQLYPLLALDRLAYAYQRDGRHDVALELCQRLLAEFPDVGQDHKFRQFVTTSERALRRRESILPKRSFSLRALFSSKSSHYSSGQRGLAIAAVVALLVLVGLAGMNEYRRRHRTLVALNDCGSAAQVVLDDGAPITVASQEKLTVAEGTHHVKITGPVTEEFDIELCSDYWGRWSKDPIWILNVGGATPLIDEIHRYAAQAGPGALPGEKRLIVGETFTYLDHLDYLWEAAPKSIRTESKSETISKRRLARAEFPPFLLFYYAMAEGNPQSALRFAESRLQGNPEDKQLLEAYLRGTEQKNQTDRARDFLATGLWHSPPPIRWHRAYQDLIKDEAAIASLRQRYDTELEQAPRDSRWLYLRGRVADEHREGGAYFRRATESDPTMAWAWMALAYEAASRGDWQECRPLAQRALDGKLDEFALQELHQTACMDLGDTGALEAQWRQRLASNDFAERAQAVVALCELLIVQGKPIEARDTMATWADTLPSEARSPDDEQACRQMVLYMLGDFPALQEEGKPDQAAAPMIRLHALASLAKAKEIASDKGLEKPLQSFDGMLVTSLAFVLAGDQEQAAAWRDRACQQMKEQRRTWRTNLALLEATTAPSVSDLQECYLTPQGKALFVAVLAARFPEKKAEYAPLARAVNISRQPPYHLVQRVFESAQ